MQESACCGVGGGGGEVKTVQTSQFGQFTNRLIERFQLAASGLRNRVRGFQNERKWDSAVLKLDGDFPDQCFKVRLRDVACCRRCGKCKKYNGGFVPDCIFQLFPDLPGGLRFQKGCGRAVMIFLQAVQQSQICRRASSENDGGVRKKNALSALFLGRGWLILRR